MASKNSFALLDDDVDTDAPAAPAKVEAPKKAAPAPRAAANKPAASNQNRRAPAGEAGVDVHEKHRDDRGSAPGGGRGGGRGSGGRAPKHDFDRQSGTGRGREVSKNGAGARNWGTPGEGADEAAADADKNADADEGAPETERKEKEISLADYNKSVAAEKAALAAKASRKAEVDLKGVTKVTKDDTSLFAELEVTKKASTKKAAATKNIIAGCFEAPPQRQQQGGRGGGRGGGMDNRGPRGPRGGGVPNIADNSAFPSLG
jgi:plasminogen activator inhibitor 1 RNA-binding protein